MKHSILFILTLFYITNLLSQTEIQDKQKVFGTWSVANSPYTVMGEAIVPSGETLIIEPGVVVKFKTGDDRDYTVNEQPSYTFNVGFLRVLGTIKAIGTSKKMITFTRDGESGYWGNIAIDSRSKDNRFKYCWIESAFYMRSVVLNTYDNATAALSFFNSEGIIENCLLINNGWTALNFKEGSSPVVKNTTIVGNKYGLECNTGSAPTITNTIVWDNETAFYVNSGSNPHISYSIIQDSEFISGIIDDGNNIFATDPQFDDPASGSYKIKSKSPAYKSGEGRINIGAL